MLIKRIKQILDPSVTREELVMRYAECRIVAEEMGDDLPGVRDEMAEVRSQWESLGESVSDLEQAADYYNHPIKYSKYRTTIDDVTVVGDIDQIKNPDAADIDCFIDAVSESYYTIEANNIFAEDESVDTSEILQRARGKARENGSGRIDRLEYFN